MTPLIVKLCSLVENPERSTWFDLGQLDVWLQFELDPELLLHLPFDDIVIVGEADSQEFCFRASFKGDSVSVAGFMLTPQLVAFKPFSYLLFNGEFRVYYGTESKSPESAYRGMAVIDCLLRRLAIPQVAYQMSMRDSFTSRRKVKAGKRPLYDWRTVEVEPRIKVDPLGGTHASPRAHDRRGHWRTLKEKTIWVRPCRVGNPADGQIFHDYKVIA